MTGPRTTPFSTVTKSDAAQSGPHYRCPACKWECLAVDFDNHGDAITPCCDEVAERYFLCETCNAHEPHPGVEVCFSCLLDESIADPRTIEQCTAELQGEIARGLAERLRPFLTRRQAA